MTVRIWINRAGPSKVHAAAMLKDNPDGASVHIIATRPDPDGAVKTTADQYLVEPGGDISDDDYARWAVNFVAQHRIDVIMPTSRVAMFARHREDFERAGARITSGITEHMAGVLDSKTGTYDMLHSLGLGRMAPAYRKISSAAELREAFALLAPQSDGRVVVKPDTGFSVDGFRILTRQDPHDNPDDLFGSMGAMVGVDSYAKALDGYAKKHGGAPALIVMPYLHTETSVDVVATEDGIVAAVPRRKEGRFRVFSASNEVMEMTYDLMWKLGLTGLHNLQFRRLVGQPYLLEINPRGSAGLYQTAPTGVNMYWLAVQAALGNDPAPVEAKLGGRVQILDYAVEA